jgi:hypothetical protein
MDYTLGDWVSSIQIRRGGQQVAVDPWLNLGFRVEFYKASLAYKSAYYRRKPHK